MYIQLISERAKKRCAEMVDCINQHNYNTGYYWYCNGESVSYYSSYGHEIPSDEMNKMLRWFSSGLILESFVEGTDWEVAYDS